MGAKNSISRFFFKEEQRFSQKWVWIVLLAFNVFFISQIAYFRMEYGYWEGSLLFTGILVLAMSVIFASLKLETEISQQGISFRWSPFQRKPRILSWKEIAEARVVQYSPISDFGGWGIRFAPDGTAAHNVNGDMGIKISLKGKPRPLLLGTQRPDKAQEALEALLRQQPEAGH